MVKNEATNTEGREMAEEKSVYLDVLKKAQKYLAGYDWDKSTVGISVMYFEETHGTESLAAMGRFIKWAESVGKEIGWIAATLGHDLNGCQDKTMCPRTSSY